MPATRRIQGARPEALFQPPPERQPLAARMRPRNLGEFVGQDHLVGERGAFRYAVTPGYFEAMRIPLRRGRALDARDVAGAPRAALISESFAQARVPGDAIRSASGCASARRGATRTPSSAWSAT